ncbi:MAG: type III pantothenate kinase, partial [Oscillospiraceae bacterium]|nr:type III pantothenate kinase [Oscillospiraceae bacterium]
PPLPPRAAQLPALSVAAPYCVIGQTTEDCMRIGAVTGAAAMIDGLTARMEEALGASASLLLTGELARCVSPLCRHPHIYEPHLLAKGLALLYTKNR